MITYRRALLIQNRASGKKQSWMGAPYPHDENSIKKQYNVDRKIFAKITPSKGQGTRVVIKPNNVVQLIKGKNIQDLGNLISTHRRTTPEGDLEWSLTTDKYIIFYIFSRVPKR